MNKNFNFRKLPSRYIFIGMSGSGKTFWSKRLARFNGYKRIEFDELIGSSPELEKLIRNFPGGDKVEKMGNYFGLPWRKDYRQKEEKYMEIERRVMSEKYPSKTILDLTGSSIYYPKEMEKIAKQGLVIYIETDKASIKKMLKLYMEDPKPVIWGDLYNQKKGETKEQALKRCYTDLLNWRAKEYEKYADVTITRKELNVIEKRLALDFLRLAFKKKK